MLIGFALELKNIIEPQFQKVLASKFFQSIADGSLSRRTHLEFLASDLPYLDFCNQAAEKLEKKVDDADALYYQQLQRDIATEKQSVAEQVEGLTKYFPADILSQITDDKLVKYGRYLVDSIDIDCAVGMAANFPCLLFFFLLGLELQKHSIPEMHPYKKWIEFYTDDSLCRIVMDAAERLNKYAEKGDESLREKMREVIIVSANFEVAIFAEFSFFSSYWSTSIDDERRFTVDATRSYACPPS